jgi:hypothetical protein
MNYWEMGMLPTLTSLPLAGVFSIQRLLAAETPAFICLADELKT